MRRRAFVLPLVVLVGCQTTPPEPPAPRSATAVDASFDATWDATIDHFAEENIPIATIERESGIIATTTLGVDPETAVMASDCGQGDGFSTRAATYRATSGVYNVLVRGDESSSSIRVTASWSNPEAPFECETTGEWETMMEQAIKERAESGLSPR